MCMGSDSAIGLVFRKVITAIGPVFRNRSNLVVDDLGLKSCKKAQVKLPAETDAQKFLTKGLRKVHHKGTKDTKS